MSIMSSTIIAPRLKFLELIDIFMVSYWWLFSDQIETLVIVHSFKLVLPDTKLFPNLRSLTLNNNSQITINDSFKTILRRLKELKLVYYESIYDSLNVKDVLVNVHDIESLSITSNLPMSAEVYAVINNMKKLKQLSLFIPIDESARGLSLPCLEKLTMRPLDWPPLENVPNLRSLCFEVELCTTCTFVVNREKMADYFRPFGHQLHHLTLNNMFLNADHVSQICSFNNLQTLKMFYVKTESVSRNNTNLCYKLMFSSLKTGVCRYRENSPTYF